MTYMNTGNPQNADPKNAYFIADKDLRADVNRLLDRARDLAGKANRGNRTAAAEYNRTVATLLDIRPALTDKDARRQFVNAQHLRELAGLIETGAVDPSMHSGPLRGAAQ
jgi:hypothetical protein